MSTVRVLWLALIGAIVTQVAAQNRVAIAHLVTSTINGSILFIETSDGLQVTGTIIGLPAGHYGFHVHELGDTSSCDASGAHFNPDVTNHGGREHDVRHVGDLGNVVFVGGNSGVAVVNFTDTMITLRGRNNILGRTLVLHAQEDDLGQGEHETSLTTGNAGPRVACGVIGIRYPADPWNSATKSIPSFVIYIFAMMFIFCVSV